MKRKLLIFSDFDGTITQTDTGTFLIDKCMGYEKRKALDKEILEGTKSFRDAVTEMWCSVAMSMDQALESLSNVQFDPYFHPFYDWLIENDIPLTVVSSGLLPLLDHFFERQLTRVHPKMKVVANDVVIHPTHWEIIYLDDTSYGHDKGHCLREAKQQIKDLDHTERPLLVFIGDGVSDLSAAHEADIVFAKAGKDLETWCKKQNLAYHPWSDFSTIMDHLKTIYEGSLQ